MQVGRDRPRIARRQAVVRQWIAPINGVLPLHEGRDLGAHHVVTQLQGRIVFLVPIGTRTRQFLKRGDALRGHRMRLEVRIRTARGEQAVIGKPLESFVHAFRGLSRGSQKFHPGAVGVFLLLALVGDQGAAPPATPPFARRLLLLPPLVPATIAPAPSSIAMIICVCACASCSRSLARWPPAKWPGSCASTPMIWFGLSDCISAPWFMKIRRPSATKALKPLSLRITTWMFCFSRPAARRIGRV